MGTYSDDEIRRKIVELGRGIGWYHYIDIGNGIVTKTQSHGGESVTYPIPKWNIIKDRIPEDLKGKSVLDIGCNAGFFCIELKRRNAGYVLGIDEREGFIKQARFVADALNMDIDYKQWNIYNISKMERKFDIVLGLGVIYHCKHPLLAAENIAIACQEYAIIESQLIEGTLFSLKNPFRLLKKLIRFRFRNHLPYWQFVYEGYNNVVEHKKEEDFNWWFPNMEGLICMFKTVGFQKIEIINEKNRASIICYK